MIILYYTLDPYLKMIDNYLIPKFVYYFFKRFRTGLCRRQMYNVLIFYMQNLGNVTTNPDEVNLSASKPRKNAIIL